MNHSLLLAYTAAPWISEWLLHHELWLIRENGKGVGTDVPPVTVAEFCLSQQCLVIASGLAGALLVVEALRHLLGVALVIEFEQAV